MPAGAGPRRGRPGMPKEGRHLDAQTMLKTAVVLLALTGAGGLLMAGIRFSGRPHPPSWIAMGSMFPKTVRHHLVELNGVTRQSGVFAPLQPPL